MTIRTMLEQAARSQGERIALRYRRGDAWQSRSYAELARNVSQVAAGFRSLGIRPVADRVVLMLENGPEWIEAYLALASTGMVVVPLDPQLRGEEVAYVLRDSAAALVVTDVRHRELLEAILPGLPDVRQIVLAEGSCEECPTLAGRPCMAYETLRAREAGDDDAAWFEANRPDPQAMASIIYTSGTTGHPKGAMLTHHNFCSDVSGTIEAIGEKVITARDDFLVILPLFHAFSFTANLLLPLARGCGMFFAGSPRTLGEDLRVLRPTVLIAVPLLVEKLLARINERIAASRLTRLLIRAGLGRLVGAGVRRSLGGRLRFIAVGGAPCPVEVLRGFSRIGLTIIEGYGLTECSPVVSINSLRAPRVGTIGRKLPNIEVRIAEPNDQGVGELQVRGPVVMKGYFNNIEATRATFDGDWLRTGDLASMDADGHITIRGRSKALIVNREGKNIYPEEVENVIASDPLVADVVVIGYTVGGAPGERVGAIVTPNLAAVSQASGGQEPPWAEVEHLLREAVRRQSARLADYKHPRKVAVHREPLKRTSIQKVKRCAYQKMLDE